MQYLTVCPQVGYAQLVQYSLAAAQDSLRAELARWGTGIDTVQCKLYITYGTVQNGQCKLCSAHFTLNSAHCTAGCLVKFIIALNVKRPSVIFQGFKKQIPASKQHFFSSPQCLQSLEGTNKMKPVDSQAKLQSH